MFVNGQDVSALPADDIIKLLSANDFPSPFRGNIPTFGKMNDRQVLVPEDYYKSCDFLKTCQGKLPIETLARVQKIKQQAEREFRETDQDIIATLKRREKAEASPSLYVKLLVDLNKVLGNHYHAMGEGKKADEYYSEAINWYDNSLHLGNRYAELYDRDDRAVVLEEGQRGILKDSPAGTLNIQTCIACVIKGGDDTTQIVHFNKGANFRKVLDEIRREMPGPLTITPIGASLPEEPTPYNYEVIETSNENVQAFVEAFKDQPDVHINAAWLLKKGEQKVTAIVVDPKHRDIKIAFPDNKHPNEVLERGLVCVNPKDATHDIELCFDMRKSSMRKPLFLTTENIDLHKGNIDALGGKNFLKQRADKISSGSSIFGPNYQRYVVLGKLQNAHEAAMATVSVELDKALGPVVEHCTHITVDGVKMDRDAAMTAVQKQVERFPKFIGEGQETLNKQLVQAVVANRDIFRTDGDAELAVKTTDLKEYAVREAGEIRRRAMTAPQIKQG